MPDSIVFRNNDTFPLNDTEIDDNFEFIASQSYVTELVFQGLANDVNAAIAALNNGSTFTTVGINDTPTSSMRLAVEADSARLTAETDDFELLLRRATSTDNVRIAFGEASVERFTFGLEGGNDFVVTASTDGISIFTALTIYGATGYANVAERLGIGVGASPSFGIHLKGGAFGGTLPTSSKKHIVQESDAAITNYFLTPDANAANLYFGCASNNDYARIQGFYNSNNPYLRIQIDATEQVRFNQYGMRLVKTYTAGTLPSAATAGAGAFAYVSDGTVNKRLAISDGTNWRWPDGTLISAVAYTVTTYKLASNESTAADTNPINLTNLVFSYEANATYRIWAMGRINPTTSTTGIGLHFDLSSTVTSIDVQFAHPRDSVGTLTGGYSIADATSAVVSGGVPAALNVPVTMYGLIITDANTGTAQLQLRAEVADIVTALAGFTLIVERVA